VLLKTPNTKFNGVRSKSVATPVGGDVFGA
jgi:hypothetical protein